MTAASCQFGSMNDTTLPGGMRAISVCASALARSCSVRQSTRMSPSTTTVRSGLRRAASRSASASVARTHSPLRYAAAARTVSLAETLTVPNLTLDPAHGHGMAIPRRRMRVDGDLGDLPVRRRVRALHFECGTARFDVEQRGHFRSDHYCRDFLAHFDDAHPEEVLDEREYRS